MLNEDNDPVVTMDGYDNETEARRGWNAFLRTVSRPIVFASGPANEGDEEVVEVEESGEEE